MFHINNMQNCIPLRDTNTQIKLQVGQLCSFEYLTVEIQQFHCLPYIKMTCVHFVTFFLFRCHGHISQPKLVLSFSLTHKLLIFYVYEVA